MKVRMIAVPRSAALRRVERAQRRSYAPSETEDELAIFLPDKRNTTGVQSDPNDWGGRGLLFSAEVIQGPAFPNLYSLRGTTYRNPATWFRSVDKLRAFDAWCMVPSHGPPLCGAENIHTLLRNFRDAIQFTHDQTIRWMNKGYTMDQLALIVEQLYLERGQEERIMRELDLVKPIQNVTGEVVSPRDYLRPFYGSVPQAVREIYVGSVGWFQADPTQLRPTPPDELARRYVALMGGAKAVNQAARVAIGNGDPTFAAELTTNVIRGHLGSTGEDHQHDVKEAMQIKARALLQLGAAAENPNWRNWYITGAFELQGFPFPKKITGAPGFARVSSARCRPAPGSTRSRCGCAPRTRPASSGRSRSASSSRRPATSAIRGSGRSAISWSCAAASPSSSKRRRPASRCRKTMSPRRTTPSRSSAPRWSNCSRWRPTGRRRSRLALKKAYDERRIATLNGSIQDFEKAFFDWFDPKPVRPADPGDRIADAGFRQALISPLT